VKILFVNQFYWPDIAATAQQLSDLAEHLAEEGHDVHVLCSDGRYDSHAGAKPPRRETHGGVEIHRLAGPGFGKRSTLGRVVDYAAFHALCGLWLLAFGFRFRIIVTLTTPPLIGVYATLVRSLTLGRTRHVCWSMDLHPDCEFELGIWTRIHPFWALLALLNDGHFRRADATVSIGRCMSRRLEDKGVPSERLRLIGVWSRDEEESKSRRVEESKSRRPDAQPGSSEGASAACLRDRLGFQGKFVVMYAGNAGLIHTFDAVCESMRRLDCEPGVLFAFVGGGRRLAEVAAFVAEHRLQNYVHIPYVPREQLGELLAAADVHLVTLRAGLEGVAVPSKLYGIMAASRPVIYAGPPESEAAWAIAEADCGRLIEPFDADGLASAIRELSTNSAERARLGENGRRYFLTFHERSVCCREWSRLLVEMAGKAAA
jgi:glycosyltransferase involved in cell wall biosynthesis